MEEFRTIEEYNDYLEELEDLVFELLENKNEQQIKDKINHIKSINSILNPDNSIKTEEDEPVKRIKQEIKLQNEIKSEVKLKNEHEIPWDLVMVANETVGLTKKLITSYVIYCLYE